MSKQIIKKFDVDNVQMYQNDDDTDFALMKLWFLASGMNSQKSPISEEVLRRDAHTALGKFVVAKYNPYINDAESHDPEEVICGYIPTDSEIEFERKDGKLFAVATAVISKLYATNVYELFKEDNQRWVSSEFTCDEGEKDMMGVSPINAFDIKGITILGKDVMPAVKGAEAKIVKFSAEEAEKYYNEHSNSTFDKLKEFSERRRKSMAEKTYKVDKSKDAMSDSPWGNVDKTSLRNKIMDASNKASLVKDVYMLVEAGWEDSPSEHLKYPVMEFKGDTLVYNRGGLSSALGYAKAENETAIVSKVEAIYKKLGLDEEKKMAEKQFEIEGRQAWGDVIHEVESHEGKGVYVDSVEKDHIIFTKDKVRYRVNADVKVNPDDKKVSAKIDWETKKKDADQKAFGEDTKSVDKADEDNDLNDKDDTEDGEGDDSDAEEFAQKKCDDAEAMCGTNTMSDDTQAMSDDTESMACGEGKKFSYDANVDMAAYNTMLANETDKYKALVGEAFDSKDMNIIMSKYLEMAKECDSLKEYKCAKEAEEVKCSVDACLAEAKDDLSKEQFEDLTEMGKKCSKDNIATFANTIKAFAYENTKGKRKANQTEHIEMRTFSDYLDNKSDDVNDIFRKYQK